MPRRVTDSAMGSSRDVLGDGVHGFDSFSAAGTLENHAVHAQESLAARRGMGFDSGLSDTGTPSPGRERTAAIDATKAALDNPDMDTEAAYPVLTRARDDAGDSDGNDQLAEFLGDAPAGPGMSAMDGPAGFINDENAKHREHA